MKKRKCRACGKMFELLPTKPGNINDCPTCSSEDVPLLAAKVAWSGKHCVEIEITKDRAAAHAFNQAQRRHGPAPMGSIITAREAQDGREASKSGSGAEKGALYNSRLGEKRSVHS